MSNPYLLIDDDGDDGLLASNRWLVTEDFLVPIAGGGGVAVFRSALRRKFADLVARGSHCVILERTLAECHYVQALLTPVGVRIEAVGAHYLEEVGEELTDAQTDLLAGWGWLPPDGDDVELDIEDGELDEGEDDEGGDYSRNWWLELTGPGSVDEAADRLVDTIVHADGLLAEEPVQVTIFPADSQDYEWVPDPDHPCSGYIRRCQETDD